MKKVQNINIDQRERLVVKSNELIQKTKYDLSIQEQRILLYVISKVKPEDEEFKEYNCGIDELCDLCGIGHSGKNYKNLRDTLQAMRDKSFWIDTGDTIKLCSWVNSVTIYKNDMMVSIRLDEYLRPHLLKLKDNFTSYQLHNALSLKSKYSIRLYEFCKSYANLGSASMSTDRMREYLMIDEDSYTTFNDLKKRVVDKSVEEINIYTDINIECETIMEKRFAVGVKFTITPKDRLENVYAMVERGKRLNPKLVEADPDD